jgi:hypothetical protein
MWRPIFFIILIVIILWREVNCVKPSNVVQINPLIVLTFTRQRWNSSIFSLSLACVQIKFILHTTSPPISSRNSYKDILTQLSASLVLNVVIQRR